MWYTLCVCIQEKCTVTNEDLPLCVCVQVFWLKTQRLSSSVARGRPQRACTLLASIPCKYMDIDTLLSDAAFCYDFQIFTPV